MKKTKFIWLNGKFVRWEKAMVHVLSHTLHYGSGAFEGIRCYNTKKGTAIFRLNEHITRLFDSFSIFNIKIKNTIKEIVKATIEIIKKNKLKEGYIRPIIFFGYGVMGLHNIHKCKVNIAIACWPWPAYLGGKAIKVKVSNYIRLHKDSVKADKKITGYYINSILASLDAKRSGYDEALLLDFKGNIAEGPGENFFIVKDNIIKTPRIKGQILPGITRDSIIKIATDLGYKVIEKEISLNEVLKADEAFFTGTAAEITPIESINNKKIGTGKLEITGVLRKNYLDIVHGKNKKYENWLTYVK